MLFWAVIVYNNTPIGVNNNIKYGGCAPKENSNDSETKNSDDICRHTGDTLCSSVALYLLHSCNNKMFAISTNDIQNTIVS